MVRLSGTAFALNCGKQNHFNLFEMVVTISSSETTKRTRQLCKAEFLYFVYFEFLIFRSCLYTLKSIVISIIIILSDRFTVFK